MAWTSVAAWLNAGHAALDAIVVPVCHPTAVIFSDPSRERRPHGDEAERPEAIGGPCRLTRIGAAIATPDTDGRVSARHRTGASGIPS